MLKPGDPIVWYRPTHPKIKINGTFVNFVGKARCHIRVVIDGVESVRMTTRDSVEAPREIAVNNSDAASYAAGFNRTWSS